MEPTNLRFSCQHCQSILEVPGELAGVKGPCPSCGNEITAPLSGSAENQRELSMYPAAQLQNTTSMAPHVPERALNVPAKRQPRLSLTETLAQERSTGTGEPVKLPQRKKGSIRGGPNLCKILGWGTSLLVTAAAAAGVYVVFFQTPPTAPKAIENLPTDLNFQVRAKQEKMEEQKEKAILQAVDVVREFLARGAPADGGQLLSSVAGSMPQLPHPLFPGLQSTSLQPSSCVRKIGTEDFITILETPSRNGRGGPIFVVEQSNGEARIQAEALQQQVEDSLANFLQDPSAPPLTCYLLAKPSVGQHPAIELDDWLKLDLMPAFKNVTQAVFIGCIKPASGVAVAVENRMKTHSWSIWTNALLQLRWSTTSKGGRFIEVSSLVPNAWATL